MDKGNGVVVIDKLGYFKKLDKIILDKTSFENLTIILYIKITNNCKLATWIIQENIVFYYCKTTSKIYINKII